MSGIEEEEDHLMSSEEYLELIVTTVYEEDTSHPAHVEALACLYDSGWVNAAFAFKRHNLSKDYALTFILKHTNNFSIHNEISGLQKGLEDDTTADPE